MNEESILNSQYSLSWDEGFQRFYSELHNRPFPSLSTPVRLSHIAVLREKSQGVDLLKEHAVEIQHLQKLCALYDIDPPPDTSAGFYQPFGEFDVRWERHSEFCTYTFLIHEKSDTPFSDPPIHLLPKSWLEGLPGKVVAAVHIEILPETSDKNKQDYEKAISSFFEGHQLIASELFGGGAEAWTAFRLHEDHFNRVLLNNRRLTECQTGRLLRCLLELETYRNMALMALPLAQEASQQVGKLEQQLAEVLSAINQLDENDERALLQQLSAMAANIADLMASTRFRFDATDAYYKLVLSRLKELREEEIYGLQTMSEFLDRRLTPAYRTSEAARRRMNDLSQRTDRASDYLRTRVDLQIEAQNQALLQSMDRRIELQLYMQETVEGLSIAAISYALVGLFKLLLGALPPLGYTVNEGLWTALFVPVSILIVWILFRAIKSRVLRKGAQPRNE